MVALILREKRDVSMEIVQHSSYNHLSEKHQEPPIHHFRIERGTGAEMQPAAIVSGIATRDVSRTDNFFPCPQKVPDVLDVCEKNNSSQFPSPLLSGK